MTLLLICATGCSLYHIRKSSQPSSIQVDAEGHIRELKYQAGGLLCSCLVRAKREQLLQLCQSMTQDAAAEECKPSRSARVAAPRQSKDVTGDAFDREFLTEMVSNRSDLALWTLVCSNGSKTGDPACRATFQRAMAERNALRSMACSWYRSCAE